MKQLAVELSQVINMLRATAWLVIPGAIGGLVGLAVALAVAWWQPEPPASQARIGLTPQQRIDEAFDAMGMQRQALPPGLGRGQAPGWIEDVKR